MPGTENKTSIFIPSIADFIFLSLFLFLSFSAGSELLNDCDTGYHIRAGEYIIENLSIPKKDIFSFHTPPIPWTAHEWLSEVIMARVHRSFGLSGVVILFSFIISLVYYLLFKMIRANNGDIIISTFVVLFVLAVSQIHWLARPHIFSLLLMVIWYYVLNQYQYNHKNHLYFFPPMMFLWVNLHGGFLTGFILLGIYILGNLVKLIASGGDEKENYKKKIRMLGLITMICLMVSLINPYGYRILLFPFNLVSNKLIMNHVNEFMSPNFHMFGAKLFEFLLLLMLMVFLFSKVRLNIIELMMVLLFTHMSLYSGRYIPLFSIIVAPILTKHLNSMIDQADGKFINFFKKKSDNISTIDASTRGFLWPVLAVILVIFFAKEGKIDFKFDAKTKPVAAVQFLKKEHLQGNMFNNDEFGDYIIYAAWPEYKVYFDGRSDMYGSDILKEYIKITAIKSGWDEILEKYNINWIIYNANMALSSFLMENDDWTLIYADNVANIFVKNVPENRYLIEKYPNVKLVIPEDDTNSS